MSQVAVTVLSAQRPGWPAYVELLKPITWFPPMWAFGCGVVASGQPLSDRWLIALAGIALAGPLVCGASQVVNDWFDREVDAINEPGRPIPSGRVPGHRGLWFAIAWTIASLLVGAVLGPWVLGATVLGVALAWFYSAPPLRLKSNGWWGNAAVGLCYEGLPWFTAVAALTERLPGPATLALAVLYSAGAHGIMTLNDFKSIGGDKLMGVRSLPVQLGAHRAARVACAVMAAPQAAVILLLAAWGRPLHASAVALALAAQLVMMRRFLTDPTRLATWYSACGVSLFVLGMLVSAFATRGLPA